MVSSKITINYKTPRSVKVSNRKCYHHWFTDTDALGKPGAGVALGNLDWWGSYSECKTIPDAHYCLANVAINQVMKRTDRNIVTFSIVKMHLLHVNVSRVNTA